MPLYQAPVDPVFQSAAAVTGPRSVKAKKAETGTPSDSEIFQFGWRSETRLIAPVLRGELVSTMAGQLTQPTINYVSPTDSYQAPTPILDATKEGAGAGVPVAQPEGGQPYIQPVADTEAAQPQAPAETYPTQPTDPTPAPPPIYEPPPYYEPPPPEEPPYVPPPQIGPQIGEIMYGPWYPVDPQDPFGLLARDYYVWDGSQWLYGGTDYSY